MRNGNYGVWGKHLDTFELFEQFRSNPDIIKQQFLSESDPADAGLIAQLSEAAGSGAPEGRVDFPYFLQTVIRHRIRDRFKSVASRWREYTGRENAQDFREHAVSNLGAIRGITGVGEGEAYPRMRSGEESGPSFAVGKYGGIYGVTFELVINDDKDLILNRIPRELGESMAEYQAQAIVAFIESNPNYIDGNPFFHSSRSNNVTSTAAAINETNIMAIVDTMSLRRDSDGMPISVKPDRVVVRKPSDAALFNKIIRSQTTGVQSEVTAGGAPQFAPGNYNAVKDALGGIGEPIVEPWLNDVNDWYLFADADRRPAFVVGYLRNQEMPGVFQQDSGMRGQGGGSSDPYSMDFDEIPFKLRHIFGVGMGEPLAAVRAQP